MKESIVTEFMQLVRTMRDAQKEYFKTRDANVLARSKELEKQVDEAIAKAEDDDIGPKLF